MATAIEPFPRQSAIYSTESLSQSSIKKTPDKGEMPDELSAYVESKDETEKWNDAINFTLINWLVDPEQLRDEGIEPPSREIILLAYDLAKWMYRNNFPPPLRVLPNGEGGIVFERKEGEIFETLEIEPDRSMEIIQFRNYGIVYRQKLNFDE